MKDESLDESSLMMEEEPLLLIVFEDYLNDFIGQIFFEVVRHKALIHLKV